jgi:2-succinyl-5-enolpyruvyl-6-hydroxy-3-cyclohexene-1-carboxylate synthase
VALLARVLRWPIIADLQSGLRYGFGNDAQAAAGRGAAAASQIGWQVGSGGEEGDNAARSAAPWIVPAHDIVTSHPLTTSSLLPDVVLQFGSPLVSAQLLAWFAKASSSTAETSSAAMMMPSAHVHQWAHAVVTCSSSAAPPGKSDPSSTVTHHLSSTSTVDIVSALVGVVRQGVSDDIEDNEPKNRAIGEESGLFPPSKLLSLIPLGRAAMAAAEDSIDGSGIKADTASKSRKASAVDTSVGDTTWLQEVNEEGAEKEINKDGAVLLENEQSFDNDDNDHDNDDGDALSEVWVSRAVTELMSHGDPRASLFVSASMPVR